MRNILFIFILLSIICIHGGCSDRVGSEGVTRQATSQEPPYFESIAWPATCSILTDGKLIINGRLVCPAGPDPEIPVKLFVFTFPGNCDPPSVIDEGEGKSGAYDPDSDSYVQKRIDEIHSFLISRHESKDDPEEFPEGCQAYNLFTGDNNEYRYYHQEDGRFRFDFDQWLRFNFGNVILILIGEDAEGQLTTATNIYKVPVYAPDVLEATKQVRHAYGETMTEFGLAMLDVLQFYPEERTVDIETITATMDLYAQAYLGENIMSNYRMIGETYRQQMEQIALDITDPYFRTGFLAVAEYIEEEFTFKGDTADAAHFQRLFAETDPIQNYWDSVQKLADGYNRFPITALRVLLPNGGMEVTIDIQKDGGSLAHFVMTGSPTAPLSVTGTIGDHEIEYDDYNPYFIGISLHLLNAGFVPVIAH